MGKLWPQATGNTNLQGAPWPFFQSSHLRSGRSSFRRLGALLVAGDTAAHQVNGVRSIGYILSASWKSCISLLAYLVNWHLGGLCKKKKKQVCVGHLATWWNLNQLHWEPQTPRTRSQTSRRTKMKRLFVLRLICLFVLNTGNVLQLVGSILDILRKQTWKA